MGNDVKNPTDSDGDGFIDALDLDSDGDSILDQSEAGDDGTKPVDTDGDGKPDYIDTDSDGDGLDDAIEIAVFKTSPVLADTDGGGISDGDEVAANKDPLDSVDDADEIEESTGPWWDGGELQGGITCTVSRRRPSFPDGILWILCFSATALWLGHRRIA